MDFSPTNGPRCFGPSALAFVGRRDGHSAHGPAAGDAAGAARHAGLGGSQQSTGGTPRGDGE